MENFTTIAMTIGSIWMIGNALIMRTDGVMAGIIFKVVPFFIGVALGIGAMINMGWIHI